MFEELHLQNNIFFSACFLFANNLSSILLSVPSFHYETGVTYKYSYQFTVLLNEDSNLTSRAASIGRNVGYRVSSEFLLSPIWESAENSKEKLIKLEVCIKNSNNFSIL